MNVLLTSSLRRLAPIAAVTLALAFAAAAQVKGPPLSPVSSLAKGRFLVAREGLPDPRFARSVVLLIGYGDNGAMGLIVNRPTEMKLSLLWPDAEELAHRLDPVYYGGPVSPNGVLVLVREELDGEEPVVDDVSVSSDREEVDKMIAAGLPDDRLRVYSGYAGWSPGQLEGEVERGDWFVWRADGDTVFEDDPGDRTWRRLLDYSAALLARAADGQRPGHG